MACLYHPQFTDGKTTAQEGEELFRDPQSWGAKAWTQGVGSGGPPTRHHGAAA